MYQSCCGLRAEFECGCCRCLSSPIRDEVGLKRDFCLQHHIRHLLTHKSPCSAHLEVPLAVCFFFFCCFLIFFLFFCFIQTAPGIVWMALSCGVMHTVIFSGRLGVFQVFI